jgi:antitoxin (DNA-binding transcriptional repressor) of toxin-antitoxin stability system
MKSITIREAQHNLASVLHEVESGRAVQILRRKQPVARLVPVGMPPGARAPVDWEGHEARMASLWNGVAVSGVDKVLDDLRGGR